MPYIYIYIFVCSFLFSQSLPYCLVFHTTDGQKMFDRFRKIEEYELQ